MTVPDPPAARPAGDAAQTRTRSGTAPARGTDVGRLLAATERRGLRVALTVRSVLVASLLVFVALTQGLSGGMLAFLVIGTFLAIGLAYRWLVVRERDRPWMRYGFVALEFLMVALAAAAAPLSNEGVVPQIFVFRVYGTGIFFFILATSALSLSPRLVLWTGGCAVAALWGAWGWIVLGMERWATWAEISGNRTAAKYIEIVLDPDHIQLANRVVETLFILATAAVTAGAVGRARQLLREQIAAEEARGRLREVFGQFVPEEVAERLDDSGGALAPAAREATVLFVDIEGFTPFAETAGPERIVAVLDDFFDRVSSEVEAEGGVVIGLIGDAAMAAFNAPLDHTDHAGAAIRAARRLVEAVATERFHGERLTIRVGVATGPVAAGTVGGRGRRAYTLYGDTVNLAQRLEAMNKETGTRILVAGDAWAAGGAPQDFAPLGETRVRGRSAAVPVYGARAP